MIDHSIPAAVTGRLLEPLDITSAVAMQPGLSGGKVFRCWGRGATACYALKQWPGGFTPQRVEEIHRVLTAARNGGCHFLPATGVPGSKPSAIAWWEGWTWDLVQWMPGDPLEVGASDQAILRGIAAITQFHAATRPLAQARAEAPAITTRMERLAQLDGWIPPLIQRLAGWPSQGPLDRALWRAGQWFGLHWHRVRPVLGQWLARFAGRATELQYVLRDVHRGHVLFQGDQVSGLVDFDALRIDTPAADLARWVGSFVGRHHRSEDLWNRVVADRQREDPSMPAGGFSDEQIEIARILAAVSPWINLANWLVWLVQEKRSFAVSSRLIAQRLQSLLDAAEVDEPRLFRPGGGPEG